MAANCVRQTLRASSASAKTLWSSSPAAFASKASKLSGLAASKPNLASRSSFQKLNSSRLPVELAGLQSLMPLHSATASALSTSLLSLHNNKWGCLSEGFATPL
ncbi:protein NUCLEAR FUSION DEFECTIVE 6, mitochondrial [Humulus lupulus]|uniref:protein NUCLEAR FUSION DEFECTIVE 6, mitochondrial n=1 Tax=Humulus lupulus TaxID=3486 RepID=UPI002B40238D|nr:protein NUCLEAR FUSION DEFECTIVE 6, mitochondrial [Humulus lupulus]